MQLEEVLTRTTDEGRSLKFIQKISSSNKNSDDHFWLKFPYETYY
eukprot:gene9454-6636_t